MRSGPAYEMQVIKDLCDKVAVLDHGVIAENGTVLDAYRLQVVECSPHHHQIST